MLKARATLLTIALTSIALSPIPASGESINPVGVSTATPEAASAPLPLVDVGEEVLNITLDLKDQFAKQIKDTADQKAAQEQKKEEQRLAKEKKAEEKRQAAKAKEAQKKAAAEAEAAAEAAEDAEKQARRAKKKADEAAAAARPAPAASRAGETRTVPPNPTKANQGTPKAPAAAAAGDITGVAQKYVGTPYVSGGGSPSGFDCSGFTAYVYREATGKQLPRSSSAQRNAGAVVSRADAKPGDLVWSPGHVAIYMGGNSIIDAPRPGKSVQVRTMWQKNPVFLRVS